MIAFLLTLLFGAHLISMPPRTRRWHAPKIRGEWWGDRIQALELAVQQGYRFIDQNVQWAWRDPANHARGGVAFVMHWGVPGRDNYLYIVDKATGRVRKMTPVEMRRPITAWAAADVYRWRRGPKPDSYRPHNLAAHAREATRVGIQIIPELKARAFAQETPAAQVVATMKRHGQQPWFMALWSMWGCARKCSKIICAGGQFAVIFGGRTRLMRTKRAVIRLWRPQPTRIWG